MFRITATSPTLETALAASERALSLETCIGPQIGASQKEGEQVKAWGCLRRGPSGGAGYLGRPNLEFDFGTSVAPHGPPGSASLVHVSTNTFAIEDGVAIRVDPAQRL